MGNNIKHKLHNSHSSNRILHRLKRASSTGSQVLENHVDRGFVVTLASGTFVRRCQRRRRRGGSGHWYVTQTQLKEFEELQNIKISPAVLSCNINVDTIEMNDVVGFSISKCPCPVWQ